MTRQKHKQKHIKIARKAGNNTQCSNIREAVEWWVECSEAFEKKGWAFQLGHNSDEMEATYKAAWDEVLRKLEETK